ncbi:MAG: hypothetical protein QN163_10340 [Armatimonadota bacterium]|nr:hypothetical protein [Armatimonadota bacterium]MDR5696157.1 hypothetical protein [Armatimonadota bacterium]
MPTRVMEPDPDHPMFRRVTVTVHPRLPETTQPVPDEQDGEQPQDAPPLAEDS